MLGPADMMEIFLLRDCFFFFFVGQWDYLQLLQSYIIPRCSFPGETPKKMIAA